MSFLEKQDPNIQAVINQELARQRDKLEMIASENFVSQAVMEAQGSVLTNKYAEGYPGKRYYGGCDKDVVFVQSGIGKVNATITATLLIEKFEVNEVIFSGVAGSLDEKLKVGDVVIGRDIVQHDVDATAFGYKMGQIPQMKEWAFESDKELIEKTINVKQLSLFGQIAEIDSKYEEKNIDVFENERDEKIDEVIFDIENKDINNITPMEALKFLSEIKAKLEEKK